MTTQRPDIVMTPIIPPGPPLAFQLTDSQATVSGGVGGWNAIARPRRRSMTEWQGPAPYTLTVPGRFDGFQTDTSVAGDVNALMNMGSAALNGAAPPVVKLSGPLPHTSIQWVINDVAWADAIRRADRSVVRQDFTITFLEYVTGDIIAATPAQRAGIPTMPMTSPGVSAAPAHPALYTIVAGDTLVSIATVQLGNPGRANEIGDLNQIRDASSLASLVGSTILLPP